MPMLGGLGSGCWTASSWAALLGRRPAFYQPGGHCLFGTACCRVAQEGWIAAYASAAAPCILAGVCGQDTIQEHPDALWAVI